MTYGRSECLVNATVFNFLQQCLLFYNSKKDPTLVYPVIYPV